ncbi:hypothetical protein LBMAG42_21040 [Deltaproteobacteria bacterium]|nr:hypothetical protein LBMAG42_21040 [Deltaproteobacteria bacterium]
MSVTAMSCPSCGAPAPATSGSCAYCGATLQVATAPAPMPGGGGGPGGGARFDLVLHGLADAHVPLLVQVLGRPPHVMAEVPQRVPPTVFGVPADQVNRLTQALGAHGVRVESHPAAGRPPGAGPQGGPRGGGPGRGGPGFGPGGPRGPGFGPGGPRGPGRR